MNNNTATIEISDYDPQPQTNKVEENALPIGPDSLTWQHFGQSKSLLLIFRAGLLQNMHPAVSRALEQHSQDVFFANPWNRLLRSLPPILGVIYDEDPIQTGKTVRDFHKKIGGKLSSGEKYHALDPDVYYWTHATFFESMIAAEEYFGTPMTEAQKEQLYLESITWYGRYAVNMRPVHADYQSFKTYWEDMLSQLQATPVTDFALALKRTPCPFPSVPKALWWLVDPIINRSSLWLARGMMPKAPRAALGWTWSDKEERRLRLLAKLVKWGFKLLPPDWRYLKRARQARIRERNMTLQETSQQK